MRRSTLLLLVILGSRTGSQAQTIPPEVTRFGRLIEFTNGYLDGSAGAADNANQYRPSDVSVNAYKLGYSQGGAERTTYGLRERQQSLVTMARREQETRNGLHAELVALYGSDEAAMQWGLGWEKALSGREASPPSRDSPSLHIAFMEGYQAGKGGREVFASPARSEDVRLLAQLYTEQLIGMAVQSERYYLVLADADSRLALTADGAAKLQQAMKESAFAVEQSKMSSEFQPYLTVDGTPSLQESMKRTVFAIEQAKIALGMHEQLEEHARAAKQLHPKLVKALEKHASRLLLDLQEAQFEDLKKSLHANADHLAAEARRLVANPPSLPREFQEMGRFLKESIMVMGKTLEVDAIRATLASGRDDPEALNVALVKYKDFCRNWREGHLREWGESRLQRMFEALNRTAPGGEGSRKVPGPFASPGAASQPTEPQVVKASMTVGEGTAGVVVPQPDLSSDPVPSQVEAEPSRGLVGWLGVAAAILGASTFISLCVIAAAQKFS